MGDLRRGAAVPRPNICARLARIDSRISALCGSDVYRINELVRAGEERQKATALQFASPPRPWKTLGGGGKAKDDLRNRGEIMHSGSMSSVRRSAASYGPESAD